MTDLLVTDELRNYLIAEAVGVGGDKTTVNALPTIWLQPKDGAFAPRRNDQGAFLEPVTITLNDDYRVPTGRGSEFVEQTVVGVTVRATQHSAAILTQRKIRNLLLLTPERTQASMVGGRTLWQMGDLLVQYCVAFNEDQFIESDDDGYTRRQRILFGVRSKSLVGQSHTPGG